MPEASSSEVSEPLSGSTDAEGSGPIPVRDVAPAPIPVRESRKPAGEEAGEEDADGSKPTPVRDLMPAEEPPEPRRPSLPTRTFSARGRQWIVRVTGRTGTGTGSDTGAPLSQLRFSRAENPNEPLLETLVPGTGIDHLFEQELGELLGRARRVPAQGEAPAGSGRRGKGSRRSN